MKPGVIFFINSIFVSSKYLRGRWRSKSNEFWIPNFFNFFDWISVNIGFANLNNYSKTKNPSASTKDPFGSDATPIAALAGNGSVKYVFIISFTRVKCDKSVK